LFRLEETKDPNVFALFEQKPYRSVHSYDMDEYYTLFNRWTAEVDAVREGQKSEQEVVAALYKLLAECTLVPGPWRLFDPDNRCPGDFTVLRALRLFAWGKMSAPDTVRQNYFRSMPGFATFSGLRKTHLALLKKDKASTRVAMRDMLHSWNEDFLYY
jgi:hypothetical protein